MDLQYLNKSIEEAEAHLSFLKRLKELELRAIKLKKENKEVTLDNELGHELVLDTFLAGLDSIGYEKMKSDLYDESNEHTSKLSNEEKEKLLVFMKEARSLKNLKDGI